MFGLLAPALALSLIGLAQSRSLAGWRSVRVHWWPLAAGSLLAQLFLHNPPVDRQPWAMTFGPAIWMLCLAAMLAVLLRNSLSAEGPRLAWRLAACAVAFNLLTVAANGGYMPQSAAAHAAAGSSLAPAEAAPTRLRRVMPLGPDSRFAFLSDVVAQPTWLPKANVVSVGDLLLSGAMAWWAFQLSIATPGRIQVRRRSVDPQ